uniref:Uncharacterized protein n=1 Tax=Lepeophtheirus salmonis TaxID=72036 RepID=A0A0K2SXT6_LEPSM
MYVRVATCMSTLYKLKFLRLKIHHFITLVNLMTNYTLILSFHFDPLKNTWLLCIYE